MHTESLWGHLLKRSLLGRPRVILNQTSGNAVEMVAAVGYIRKLQNAVTPYCVLVGCDTMYWWADTNILEKNAAFIFRVN